MVSKAVQVRLLESQNGLREVVGGTFTARPGGWTLVAMHRAGSLGAAVAQLRRRNLGISGGILMLLGGSVVMMLYSSRRAQRLARQQIEFVSAVSHELRTPLAVICSAGENLADGVVENSNQTRQYGAVVRNEGRRLSEMVEQILDFSGMEAGRKSYKVRPVAIADVVRSAIDACEVQIHEKGFALETHLRVEGALIMADLSALARAVQNLINNALKYSGKSRWIAIRAGLSADKMWITVEDKGIGIPSSDLPHIFEPFYRGREVVDAQINGSGLGLSLVKQIVEVHGGSVDVASVRGQGTTFKILLPVCPIIEENSGE
jgi:signal transduction histidine kinase